MKKVLLCSLLVLCFSAVSASAQIMSNPSQWYINNQIYSTRVFNGVVANSMLRRSMNGKNRSTAAVKPGQKTAGGDSVFKASPNNALPKIFAAKTVGGTQNQRQTEQVFDTFISLYKQTAQKDGFPANDLAYAFQYFVVNNYQIYHDLVDLPLEQDPRAKRARDGFDRIKIMNDKKLMQVSMTQERAIYNQFRTMLSSNAELQKMTDAQKQEASELFAIMFGVNFTGYMKGVSTPDDRLAEQARQMAREGLEKLLGVPIDQIKITNNGLEL